MKNQSKKKRYIMVAIHLLLILTIVLLLVGSIGFMRDGPTVHSITYVDKVSVSVNGAPWQEVNLPHNFKNLPPRTPVVLRAKITPSIDDGVYIKTVYSPAKVYLEDNLVFEFGKRENYPSFMLDPATEIHIVETYGNGKDLELKIEYLSPKTSHTLSIHPPMVGTAKELILERFQRFGIPLMFSVVQIVGGISLILISACIMIVDKKGLLFLWLGLFSLTTGAWAFGENNFSVTIFRSSTFLYLLSFIGLFSFIVPLIQFIRTIIDFENKKTLWYMELFFVISATVALFLQLVGVLPCSKSILFFHLTLPASLVLLTVLTCREYIKYKNIDARRFIFPMGILAFSAILELFNYQNPVIFACSSIFQIGILFFLLIMGITAGIYVKDSINLKNGQRELEFQKKLLDIQTNEQKENRLLLAKNEQILSRQRHDLRHHLAVIQELAGDNKELKEYLDTLTGKIPKAMEHFCENSFVNAVISHYSSLCEEEKISFSAKLDVPETGNRSKDSDLCVVFANLLENAVEACQRMKDGEKFIKLRSGMQYDFLTITIDNSFSGDVKKDGERFYSSKRNAFGIGLVSVKDIAQKSGGDAEFQSSDNVFFSSVYLKLK